MADLGSTRVFGKLTVMHDIEGKGSALLDGEVEAGSFKGAGTGLTGTSAMRATGTTKADVGLSKVDNFSQADYDVRYAPKTHTHPVAQITGLGNAATHNYGTLVNTIAQGNDTRINNGQTAFSWGNHASAGYIKSFTNTTYTASTGLTLTGTVFSVNYGTAAGTAAQGNDTRINNGQTAFSWGNHASAGYIKSFTNTTYTGGTGLTLTGTVFSVNYGTTAGTAAQGDDTRINNGQAAFARLNIGTTVATARTALQLGNTVTHNYGTAANTVMMGNDSRVLSAAQTRRTVVTLAGNLVTGNEGVTLLKTGNGVIPGALPIGWNCTIVADGAARTITLTGTERVMETNLVNFVIPKDMTADIVKIKADKWVVSLLRTSLSIGL